MQLPVHTELLGDRAVLVRLGDRIDPALNRAAHALAARLRAAALPGVVEIVPAFASVAVLLDELQALDQSWLDRLDTLLQAPDSGPVAASGHAPLRLAVRFDGADLAEVATRLGCSRARLVERLCAGRYTVAMLGFLPGFPYLLGLDPALALPRRAEPRSRVPPNSLALGGSQLGIYPWPSPGGWHLLGQVELPLFDPRRQPPALLAPGARLQLVAAG